MLKTNMACLSAEPVLNEMDAPWKQQGGKLAPAPIHWKVNRSEYLSVSGWDMFTFEKMISHPALKGRHIYL